MSDSKWDKVVVGTPITCLQGDYYYSNYVVAAKGYNWAVLREENSEQICMYVLAPDDIFELGKHEYCEENGRLEFEAN